MNIMCKAYKQQGFTLVTAIFVLIVLALLGSYMVRMSATQRQTTVYVIQGARAYQAARAGIEWAVARIGLDGNCAVVNGTGMSFSGLDGFSVTLTCGMQSYTEVNNVDVFTVTSTSAYGSYTSPDFIYRQLQMTLVQ